jgi:hypothetical protein|nr:MAG TPA: hypothetical protein [Caudoviricetes sp.]
MPKTFCSNAGLPGSFTKALSYDEQIQFLIDKYNKMADVINNLKIDVDISDVVKYIPQTGFSELQKQQATENIGAVSTIANQILNEDEQMNARENINAMEYEAKDDFVKAGGAVVYDENFINILPNTNLATITYCEPGRYYCADITGITGFSAAMPFEMEVFKVNSNLVRRYFQYDNGRKYVQEVELNPLKFYAVVDFGGFNISYLLQDLTEDQEAQARSNIGAGTSNITSDDISTQINNNSVKFSGAQNLTEAQKARARANIGAGTGSGSAENAVLYIAQELTDEQKTQARNNIGAGTSNITSNDVSTQIDNNSVKFSSEQNLTGEQKLQARNNIGAGVSNVVTFTRSATCAVANWVGTGPYTQELTVQGIVADSQPVIDYDFSGATTSNIDILLDEYNKVNRFVTDTNKITAYCYGNKPTVDVPINILVVI